MSNIPVARSKRPSYENFVAECPSCGRESVFNRASDLRTFEPIAGRDVSCQSADCGKPFRIVGDSVNSAHEMLVFDCYELLERKHYMNAVLSLAQAYEVFFSLFFRVELLYRPFGADPDKERADLDQLSEALHEKLKEHTFAPMRALFLQHMVSRPEPKGLAEAAALVAALPDHPGDPKDAAIDSIADAKVVPLLKALKATTIHSLRNRIVHKQAYRPTRQETEEALEEARSILFPLTSRLDLHDEINWYMRAP
jgi:hypothetical protein